MTSLRRSAVLALTLTLTLAGATALAQTKTEDEAYWTRDLLSRIQVNGYAQAGYTYTHRDGRETNTWDVKRTLLWAKARVTDRWSMLFMYDFSSVVQEFYTDYRITRGPELTVRFGQFKNQLSLENPLSPTTVELVDVYSQAVTYLTGCGSDPLYGVQYGRDLGIDLYGQLWQGRLLYNVQVLNGSGINVRDRDNRKDFIVRLDYRPLDGLRLVASAQKGYGTALAPSPYLADDDPLRPGDTYRRDRWTVGAEYKAATTDYWRQRCATIHGEVLGGRDSQTHSWGGYVTASVPLVDRLDVVASYDYCNYAVGCAHDQTNLVAGLQWWFFRKCRFSAQYTWSDSWDHGCYSRIQLQTQVAF